MDDETLKLLLSLSETEPFLMEISSDRVNLSPMHKNYKMCSSCYAVINNTWDHQDWCALYQQEDISKWLENGNRPKT